MKYRFLWMIFFIVFSFAACDTDSPTVGTPGTGDDKTDIDTGDTGEGNDEDQGNTGDSGDTGDPDDDKGNTGDGECDGDTCKIDDDCCDGFICESTKCSKGCEEDSDCSSYPGTKCNTKLNRCLNIAASGGACDSSSCANGCCVGMDGFTKLICEPNPSYSKCGACKQGEVYLSSELQCVPAACMSDSKCESYNSSEENSECFVCNDNVGVCEEDTDCNTGSGSGIIINVRSCIPAGEKCTHGGKDCCSGQPCINGYCY